jgi:hypothetical protein
VLSNLVVDTRIALRGLGEELEHSVDEVEHLEIGGSGEVRGDLSVGFVVCGRCNRAGEIPDRDQQGSTIGLCKLVT